MMQLLYKQTANILEQDVLSTANNLIPYIEYMQEITGKPDYPVYESSINLPFDEKIVSEVLQFSQKLENIKLIVLIGIGGSSLGTKALYHALFSDKDPKVEIVFLESVSTVLPDLNFSDPGGVLVNMVSKSGTTMETKVNLQNLLEKYPSLKDRIVYTTSTASKDSYLKVFNIPEKVGGRYCMFSPVGLFPLAVCGLDVVKLLEGAMQARKDCLETTLTKNPAAISASIVFSHYKDNKNINVEFLFPAFLENLGKWWRQLMAESLGKDGKGVTPVVSVGTDDLHSMLQLYLDGPRDKFTEFVYPKSMLPKEVSGVLNGVKNSYSRRSLPYTEFVLEDLTEKSLGYYMQYKMIETMYLGNLLGIDAFNQPAIEEYKKFSILNS